MLVYDKDLLFDLISFIRLLIVFAFKNCYVYLLYYCILNYIIVINLLTLQDHLK